MDESCSACTNIPMKQTSAVEFVLEFRSHKEYSKTRTMKDRKMPIIYISGKE